MNGHDELSAYAEKARALHSARLRTRYQRMSFAMRVAELIEARNTDDRTLAMCKAIRLALAAPFETATGYIRSIPELHELLAEVSQEKSRI